MAASGQWVTAEREEGRTHKSSHLGLEFLDMTTAGPSGPPPGWYPDPEDPSRARWWSGNEWAPPRPARPGFMTTLDFAQRIVLVVGMGLALCVFGLWITHIGSHSPAGYRPMLLLRAGAGSLPRWARFLLWLVLIVAWSVASLWVLHQPKAQESERQ